MGWLWTTRLSATVVVGAWHYAGIRGPEATRVFRPEATPVFKLETTRGELARSHAMIRPEASGARTGRPGSETTSALRPCRASIRLEVTSLFSAHPRWLEAWASLWEKVAVSGFAAERRLLPMGGILPLAIVMGSAVSCPLFGGLRLLRGLLPPCPVGTFDPPVG